MVERLPPSTTLINSIRAERSSYHSWAGEGIDNALDAEARRITLTINDKCLEIVDDGVGITRDRASAIVQISQHADMVGTKLGRFGVGIKYKAVQHGNRLDVVSISRHGKLRRYVDWREILRGDDWDYPDAEWSTVAVDAHTGTKVRISDLIGKRPRQSDIDKIHKEIQRRYYPAIEDGVRITLNDSEVEAVPAPLLVDPVSATLTFPGGREARVRGGLLADPNSKLRQVDLCVAYRVIKPECGFGCNGYGGIRAMYARVDLIGPAWKLTKFKDDIADDPYEDELEAAVEEILRPVLEKCESQSMDARHRELENQINDLLPEEVRMARPEQKQRLGRRGEKRGDERRSSDLKPGAGGSGTAKTRKPSRGFRIDLVDKLCEEYGYGRAEVRKASVRIQLAKDCPHVARLAELRDQQSAAIGLYALAIVLFEGEQSCGQLPLDGSLGLRAWKIGQQQNIPEAAE